MNGMEVDEAEVTFDQLSPLDYYMTGMLFSYIFIEEKTQITLNSWENRG